MSPQVAQVGSGFFYVIALEEMLQELRRKREMLHVVITGRNAKEELIDLADLVTDMRLITHPYKAGIKAQRGVEF
jgi:cob(I)alamin adenosyltransferase